jgi:diguanylate cyclase (GGDEF)-like protein/putative nucleotidyltransferase with HDIG domain/PAS domain S-box-containing protein
MKRLSATTRLSSGVAALTLSVLLAAHAMDLIPSGSAAMLQGRKELCEAVALRCSTAIQEGELAAVRKVVTEVMTQNRDVASAAIRRSDGSIVTQFGNHAMNWVAPPGDGSTPTHVRVPVFDGDRPWGTIEMSFRPGSGEGASGILGSPLLRLCLFVAAGGFLAYHFYLRRSLQYLDPQAVIPDRVKTMLDTLAEGVLVLDKQQRIVLANAAFAAVVGEPAADLQGVPAARFNWTRPNPDEVGQDLPWVESLEAGHTRIGVALCLARKDEEVRTFTVNCGPIAGGDGAPRGALVTFDDVTSIEKKNTQLRKTLEMLKQSRDEINRQNEELQALATTDPLTGCSNRRSFFARFDTHWNSARRYGYKLSVVMVDVDRFKGINDRHGHSVGDQVLQHVAGVLKSLAREGDLVCRYGGEEFCVLLTHTDTDGAAQAAERYREAIESSAAAGIAVTASLGVSCTDLGAESPQSLIDEADKALYAAKQSGRNRYVRWDQMPAGVDAEMLAAAAVASELAGGAAPQAAHGPTNAAPAAQEPRAPTIPFGAVTALMAALRYRDAATAAHSQRVADLCVALAKGRLSVRECFVLEVAAMLHDIGKLGVPDAILLKPGPLSDEEWVVMRAHDRMGAEIVAAAFASDELTKIVQTHHAWFGGNARDPDLPRGAGIPLPSRILSICDAFDAMTSDRVYRKGRTREAAFEELRRCAGKQFDPELVEQFVGLMSLESSQLLKAPSDAEGALARVQEQAERLALALEAHDLSLLRAMAGRMVATAGRDGLESVAKVAADLEQSAAHHPDVLQMLRKVNELMNLCRAAGRDNVKPAADAPAPSAVFHPGTLTV